MVKVCLGGKLDQFLNNSKTAKNITRKRHKTVGMVMNQGLDRTFAKIKLTAELEFSDSVCFLIMQVQLGDLCLMSSLRALPSKVQMVTMDTDPEKWYNVACTRQSVVGKDFNNLKIVKAISIIFVCLALSPLPFQVEKNNFIFKDGTGLL